MSPYSETRAIITKLNLIYTVLEKLDVDFLTYPINFPIIRECNKRKLNMCIIYKSGATGYSTLAENLRMVTFRY